MAYEFDLSETIREGLEGNVYFRETKAAQYPQDWRNRVAVDSSRALMTGTVSVK